MSDPLDGAKPVPSTKEDFSFKEFKRQSAFWISLLVNFALVIVCLVFANHATSQYNQGSYDGQARTYKEFENLGYGLLTFRKDCLEFKLADKEKTIYIYNRNYYPNQRDYPTGKPPRIKGESDPLPWD